MMEFIQFKRGGHAITFAATKPAFEGNSFLPQHAIIPLSCESDVTAVPVVAYGDFVQEGQILARAHNKKAVNVHASVPGIISGFITTELPDGSMFHGVHIKTQGPFALLGKKHAYYNWRDTDSDVLLDMIGNRGLVSTVENSTVSLAATLHHAKEVSVNTIHLRLYDQDPTSCLDSFLSQHFLNQIAEGVAIIAKSMNITCINISVPSSSANTQTIAQTVKKYMSDGDVRCNTVSKKYPITPLSHKGKIMRNTQFSLDIDASTALSVYECIACNQPMLYTYVLLTGKALKESKVFKVRIGTPIGNLIEECGGFKTKTVRIIVNGLIRGISADNLDLPIGKGIKSIHAVNKDFEATGIPNECKNCGQCLRSCPAYTDPIKTVRAIQKNAYTDDVLRTLDICKGCACCSMVCPARIPLCAIIQKAAAKQGKMYAS